MSSLSNLDETTRSVYKENVRLNAALGFHLKEGQDLKKVCLVIRDGTPFICRRPPSFLSHAGRRNHACCSWGLARLVLVALEAHENVTAGEARLLLVSVHCVKFNHKQQRVGSFVHRRCCILCRCCKLSINSFFFHSQERDILDEKTSDLLSEKVRFIVLFAAWAICQVTGL